MVLSLCFQTRDTAVLVHIEKACFNNPCCQRLWNKLPESNKQTLSPGWKHLNRFRTRLAPLLLVEKASSFSDLCKKYIWFHLLILQVSERQTHLHFVQQKQSHELSKEFPFWNTQKAHCVNKFYFLNSSRLKSIDKNKKTEQNVPTGSNRIDMYSRRRSGFPLVCARFFLNPNSDLVRPLPCCAHEHFIRSFHGHNCRSLWLREKSACSVRKLTLPWTHCAEMVTRDILALLSLLGRHHLGGISYELHTHTHNSESGDPDYLTVRS